MPKLVDHAVRRHEVADALFRVVRAHGIHAVSVRSVAAEVGASPSALRHYFATQDELLGFALQAITDRVLGRIEPRLATATGRAGTTAVLEEILPLDKDRRDETEVWLAFVTRAQTAPGLREIRDRAEAMTRDGVRYALSLLTPEYGPFGADAVDRTYHLVDGLALHGTLWPQRYPPEHIRAVLAAHLDSLVSGQPSR